MDDLQLASRIAAIREDLAGEGSRGLLHRLLGELAGDIPTLSSVDVPRLRALALLMSDVAPHQPGAERAAAKEAAAVTDRLADFLAVLGEAAREGFGG